jgi:hypothetical protein
MEIHTWTLLIGYSNFCQSMTKIAVNYGDSVKV